MYCTCNIITVTFTCSDLQILIKTLSFFSVFVFTQNPVEGSLQKRGREREEKGAFKNISYCKKFS